MQPIASYQCVAISRAMSSTWTPLIDQRGDTKDGYTASAAPASPQNASALAASDDGAESKSSASASLSTPAAAASSAAAISTIDRVCKYELFKVCVCVCVCVVFVERGGVLVGEDERLD